MTSEHPERADRHGLHKDWERRREQMRDKAREERKNGNKPYDWYSPKPIHFVAWDGESWNPNEEYRLIQNSDGYVLRALDLGRDYLTIHDVLPEITRRRDPNFRTVHVIYAGGFDFNMLFRHETEVIRKGVFGYKGTPGSVWPLDEKWEARYIPRKMLKIRPIGSTRFPHVIYDVWGFFSATGSFLKTLDKWKIRSDPIIAEGKKRREDFSPRTFDIERYNSAETLALKRLMDAFYESLKTLDSIPNIPRLSRIRSYHGAGSLADKILHELKAEHMKNGDFSWDRLELEEGDLMDAFPLDVWKAIWAGKDKDVVVGHGSLRRWIEKAGHVVDYKRKMSYFGGRIELLQRGEFDRIYNYDINSCYPRAIIDLPDLSVSKWRTWTDFNEEDLMNTDFGLCEVEWQGSPDDSIGPLPLRTDGTHIAKGYVIFPTFNTKGNYFRGIYHLTEVREAVRKGLWDVRLIGSAWTIDNGYPKAFSGVAELAKIRLRLKSLPKDDPMYGANEPLKLGLNSLYGKFAQKMMGDYPPKYRELVWAGYATAYGRSQLLRYCKPDDTVLFATDGIYSTSRLGIPRSEIGDGLGQWEEAEGPGKFLIAGIYDFNGTIKHRGYPNLDFEKAFKVITLKAKNGLSEEKQNFHSIDTLFVGVKRSLMQFRRYPEARFYYNRQRLVNWNHNEKRTQWLLDGNRWISSPVQSSQTWSYPYDWKDFDELEEEVHADAQEDN